MATTTPTVGYASVNGIEMYYEVHGTDGPPLVLLHGGALTIESSFGALVPALAATRRVIAVEFQGHGHTADADREITLAAFAADVLAVLDQLGVERADFVGFSLGGLVALATVTRHPERVDRLVLLSTQYRHDGYHPELGAPEQTSRRLPTEDDYRVMLDAYTRVAPDPSGFPTILDKVKPLAQTFVEWTDDELRAITAPTLLVLGDTDFVRIEHAARMHELIPHARLAILPDTTHFGMIGRAELLIPLVDPFLSVDSR
ncbi:alpha/beta fold hydrolase [Embleya sp. AB8]|uniref:alpha/beta fold hydrolase n=1 Tax=Embleya sp. AB8 TaxID=3156304 RepID=UPI003C74CEA2